MSMTDSLIKILLVDDQPKNLLTLTKWLEKPTRQLWEAHSGNEALEMVLEHEFALILLDVEMPDMDGFETATLIRNNRETSQVPIIFITATRLDEQFLFQGYDSGAADYLLKPFDPAILQSKVNVFVDLYRQRKQLEEEILVRQQVEQELLAQRKWLETILASITDAMVAMDSQGKITFLNTVAESITGWSSQELRGHLIWDMLHFRQEDTPFQVNGFWKKVMEDGQTQRLPTPLQLKEKKGNAIPIKGEMAPIRKSTNQIAGVLFTFQDLTAQKEAEQSLLEVEQTLCNLLSPREQEILQLIVDGNSTKVIAIDLNVSERTVEAHRRNLMQKLQIRDLASLVRFAITHHMVRVD